MKTSFRVVHGKRQPGTLPKVCENCREDYLAHCRNQRFCTPACGKQYRFITEARQHKMRGYGLTVEQYESMLAAQGGVCKICRRPELRTRKGQAIRLAVDHDHKTNEVRGLLCTDCNRGLGMFHDDPAVLRSAAEYLEDQCV